MDFNLTYVTLPLKILEKKFYILEAVLRIRIHRIHMFLPSRIRIH
jgi:hypothetical protein